MTVYELVNGFLDDNQNIIVERCDCVDPINKRCCIDYTNEVFHGRVREYKSDDKTDFENRSEEIKENTIYNNRMESRKYDVKFLKSKDDTLYVMIEDPFKVLINV